MNYRNSEAKEACECSSANIPHESMTDMMRETSNIAADLLSMSRRINSHLFGQVNQCCEKEGEPTCFMEELKKTRGKLLEMAKELNELCCLFGM